MVAVGGCGSRTVKGDSKLKIYLLISAALVFFSAADVMGAPTVLSCDGITTNSGRNEPNDSLVIPPRNESATFAIASNGLTSQSLVLYAETLSLCKETPTEYVYSTNCAAQPRAFIGDWLAMKDASTAGQLMAKKYGEYSVVLETIQIDRVNLTISDEFVSTQMSTEFKKTTKGSLLKSDTRFFVFTTEFRGHCRLAKAQF